MKLCVSRRLVWNYKNSYACKNFRGWGENHSFEGKLFRGQLPINTIRTVNVVDQLINEIHEN